MMSAQSMSLPTSSVATSQFQFGPWTITVTKSHILESEGLARERFEEQLELPRVPEMIFADNVLLVQHAAGFGIAFTALDALKMVDAHHDLFKVAVSQAWREARADCEHINEVVKPYDWTFTTDYAGTLLGTSLTVMKIEPTQNKINIEKLKLREKIHFYEDIMLFEDELSDNGTSVLNVKIRVMPTSFFILLRQFMRVDNVIVRIIETRLHHEVENNFILREHICKESTMDDMKAPAQIITDPNELSQILPVQKEVCEKLIFPDNCDLDIRTADTTMDVLR